MRDERCAASGAQAPCARPESIVEDGRVQVPEPVDSKEDTMSACTCDEARIGVHVCEHDKLDERGRNGGGVDDDGAGGGIISGHLLSYWTRSSLAVATSPRSMLFGDWYSTPSRDAHGDEDGTVSETGHVTVSGHAGISTSTRGGPDATVSLGWMMGFVDLSYL